VWVLRTIRESSVGQTRVVETLGSSAALSPLLLQRLCVHRNFPSFNMKLSAFPLCYMGMETELESMNGTRNHDVLARRLANGDPGAPGELVRRHHTELYRYASALLRDTHTAEDAVQDAFERAFTALGKYPKNRIECLSLRAWLYRITLNVVRNAWRNSRREVPVAETPEGADGRFETPSGSDTSVEDKEAWLDALGAMGRLSERQRVAVALRYIEDLPYAGISDATGWPENTCKTLVRRGIERLGAVLSDRPEGRGGS
jgi:RNA polymerase sigma-70 factor (ECF subfamily)